MVELVLVTVNKKIWGIDFTNQVLVDDGGFKRCIKLTYVGLIHLEAILMKGLICDDLEKLITLVNFL
jgi:hypothetical protein